MRAHELLALSRYDVAKKIRDQVEPGDYDVDVEVRVHGTIRVGEDHEAEVTAAIPWQRVCAVLLDKLNDVTIESVLSEALGDVDDSEIKAQAAAAMVALKGSTTKIVKGAVTTKLAHDELEGD